MRRCPTSNHAVWTGAHWLMPQWLSESPQGATEYPNPCADTYAVERALEDKHFIDDPEADRYYDRQNGDDETRGRRK